jgi:hypothetical protein
VKVPYPTKCSFTNSLRYPFPSPPDESLLLRSAF